MKLSKIGVSRIFIFHYTILLALAIMTSCKEKAVTVDEEVISADQILIKPQVADAIPVSDPISDSNKEKIKSVQTADTLSISSSDREVGLEKYEPAVIIDSDYYDVLYETGSQAYGLMPNVEVILTKMKESNTYYHYDIFITDLAEDHEHLQIGKTFTVGMTKLAEAHQAMDEVEIDFLINKVMIPGRKIKITLNAEGNLGNYTITQVEVLDKELVSME